MSRQTPTRSEPAASTTRATSAKLRPTQPPEPALFSTSSRARPGGLRSMTSRMAPPTWASTDSNPAPRWEPGWKTTPSASMAAASSM